MAEINLVLNGEPGEISAEALSGALSHLIKLIRSVDGGAKAPLTVTGLAIGSVSATLDTDDTVAHTVSQGIALLRNSAVVPPGWHHKSLKELDALRRIGTDRRANGVTGVNLYASGEIAQLDAELASNIREASHQSALALTTVRGKVVVYSHKADENSRYIVIQPQGRTPAVRVNIPEALAATAIDNIEKTVEVLGLGCRADDGVNLKTIDARRIDSMPDNIPHLSIDEIIGSWEAVPGATADSAVLVREFRDAW